MEEATAEQPATAFPLSATCNHKNSLNIREEGELSSSQDDEFPGASRSQFKDSTPVLGERHQVASVNRNTQLAMMGKSALADNPAHFVSAASITSVQPNHRKGSEKNRVPFVISFSDDDSGSDSEEFRQGESIDSKEATREVDGSRKPSTSLENSQMSRQNAGNGIKIPKKMASSRTFVSSMTRINGTSSRNGGPLSFGLRSLLKNSSTHQKNKAGQNIHVNSTKLQDLRQLIAIRENELKLKAAKLDKETASGSSKDYTVTNSRNGAARSKDSSADLLLFETKEPERKRRKVSEPHSSNLNSVGGRDTPPTESILTPEKSVLENCAKRCRDDCSCCDKEIVLGASETSATRTRKKVKNHSLPSANLPNGSNIINHRRQNNKITKQAEPSAPVTNRTSRTSPKKSRAAEMKHPSQLNSQHGPSAVLNSSVPKEAICQHNLTSSALYDGISNNEAVKHRPADTCQAFSIHVPDSNLEISDACQNNPSFWNGVGNAKISGTGDMDIQSLMEIEELQDKELDDSQELRRKCEVEERNALKAYRKAQRALAEANARCSYLYRKRELFSAHLRSRMMEDSSLFWSTSPHEHIGAIVNSLTEMSEDDMHLVTSSHQMQNELTLQNQHRYDSSVRSTDGAVENLSDLHEDVEILASDPSDPDTSTSEPQEDNGVANVVCSLSHENALAEDEETFSFDLKAVQSNLDRHRKDEIFDGRTKDANVEPTTIDAAEDSLLLEASLRSQLFARLGIKNSQKKGSSQSLELAVEREAKRDVGGEIIEITGNITSSEAEKDSRYDFGDIDRSDRSISEHPMDIKNQCQNEKVVCMDCESSSMAGPVLRSAFGHVKVPAAFSSVQSQTKNLQAHTSHIYDEKGNVDSVYGIEPTSVIPDSMEYTSMNVCASEVGSYTSNLAIDPFWPLCMYELRGKCNNDECTWQHVKNYSSRSIDFDSSNSIDCLVHPSQSGKYHGPSNLSKYLGSRPLAPPTYLVCFDILKADSHPYKYLLAQSVGERWQKCFSVSLVVSSSLPSDLHSDEPCLHGPEARIEVHGGWNRQSSYFHHRNGKVTQPDQHTADDEQDLEMALVCLNREVNKQKGRMEALRVLARALEAYPTSVVLWIVYLQIHYCNQKSIGKDDMYLCAVEHNGASYELWLMFINSRDKLDDRLLAYDTALLALCHHASTPDSDARTTSPCILDLFLQMINCLCISGEVGKAVQKIYGLFPSTKQSSESNVLFLPDILICLNIHDKCVFWVCCVYLVVYKKLPDAIVHEFEFQKQLSSVEWPSAHLTVDEKQQAVKLMELAVDSLALYIDSESLESITTLRTSHLFAVNHIRCIEVLEGFECSKNLLEKYVKLYPSCLELVLLSARAGECDSNDTSYVGFEEAISNWMDKVPGVQCIWNQYAEFALRNGKIEFAKQLLERWFHSVWEVQYPRNETLDINAWISNSSQTDVVYGLLNFSLHQVLQNEHIEARSAIEQALEVASAEDYRQCVQEHAMFLLKDDSSPLSGVLNLLNGYLTDSRASLTFEPFSRSFIKSIKKPRVQQLVNNLLSPISSDFSPLNLVLKSCYTLSLIPQVSSKLKDVVDFAEAIMEIMPANYQLAISFCKLLCKTSNSANTNVSVSFWASSLLINSLFQAVPVAPEYIWLEAASILHTLAEIQSISESFHKRALSVYPFSRRLWKSYLSLSKTSEHLNSVIEAAREKGIKLG